MLKEECKHIWKKQIGAGRTVHGTNDAMFICENCGTEMTASEVFQLEELENQNKEIKNLKKHRAITIIVSIVAIVISILTLIFK